MRKTVSVALAADRSTRMKPEANKILLPILGKPMMRYLIRALRKAIIENANLIQRKRRLLTAKGGYGDNHNGRSSLQPAKENL